MRFHYPHQQQLDNYLSLVDLTYPFLSQINSLWAIKTSMVLWGEEVEKPDLGTASRGQGRLRVGHQSLIHQVEAAKTICLSGCRGTGLGSEKVRREGSRE